MASMDIDHDEEMGGAGGGAGAAPVVVSASALSAAASAATAAAVAAASGDGSMDVDDGDKPAFPAAKAKDLAVRHMVGEVLTLVCHCLWNVVAWLRVLWSDLVIALYTNS